MWDGLVQALHTVVDVDSDSDRHGAAKAKYDILFHCHGGVNRSTAAICVFLRQFKGLTLIQAILCITSQRRSLKMWHGRGSCWKPCWTLNQTRANRDHHDAISAARCWARIMTQ